MELLIQEFYLNVLGTAAPTALTKAVMTLFFIQMVFLVPLFLYTLFLVIRKQRQAEIPQNIHQADHLNSNRWWRRLIAIATLEPTTEEMAGEILKLVEDKHPAVALAAMHALSKTSYPKKEEIILGAIRRLPHIPEDSLKGILLNLAKENPRALLEEIKRGSSQNVTVAIIQVLSFFQVREAVPTLIEIAEKQKRYDPLVTEITRALGTLADPRAKEWLFAQLRHANPSIRAASVYSLISLGEKFPNEKAFHLEKDNSIEVRRAIRSQARAGRKTA